MTTTKEHPKRAYKAHRARQIAYGRWEPYMDAAPVREHVQTLLAYRLTYDAVARLAGVSRYAVEELMEGHPERDRPRSRRMLKQTGSALLAARFDLDAIPDTVLIDASGTIRRMQALVAAGYTISFQARRLGKVPTNVHRLLKADRVTAAVARQMRDLFNELAMTAPQPTREVAYAKAHASRNEWLPPMAWDDDLIDMPDDVLDAELRRRVADMDMAELARCDRARRVLKERSPLIVAASREYRRRCTARQRGAEGQDAA